MKLWSDEAPGPANGRARSGHTAIVDLSMPLIAVTRLRIRSLRFLLPFAWHPRQVLHLVESVECSEFIY